MADGSNDEADLGATKSNDSPRSQADAAESEAMLRARSAGFRILGEFVAAIVAGLLIGYLIDRVLGTLPAFLIVFLLLGMAAGFLNIYRIAAPPRGGANTGG